MPRKPPKARPGYRWEWREGCRCASCPWKGNCLGETWEHWREVAEPSNVVVLPVVRIER